MNRASEFRGELLDFYFACSNYLRTAEYFDTFYVSYFERVGKVDLRAKLFCLDPAPMLAAPLERSQSTIFFSATLLPIDYFKKLLTGPADHPSRAFRSPFPTENVRLLIHNRISTKYKQRADSYTPIASAIETICSAHVGNYLVFFPSYAYLAAVLERVKERVPEEQLLVQDRGMTEEARETFLAQFSAGNQATLIGFAVMGGIFGEGIDLVGERLIGTVVVGVGIPQMGLERDLIKRLADFPETVQRTAAARAPHILCEYLEQAAGAVNSWYHAGNPSRSPELAVLAEDNALRTARLALARGVRIVLRNGLEILGVSAPTRMDLSEEEEDA